MSLNLKISPDLSIPPDAVTQTFAILAMRRIGKTYTASVMAEEFVAASLPFVVLDPTGAWWGLRAAADGKSEGLPVVIIGGAHGDVPLEASAGKVIADLVVEHPGFYVLDMSSTNTNAEQDRFACDFAERLYQRKKQSRSPLHLFVDEADSFAPQRPFPGQQRMLGAFEAIVRRGGICGLGTTLITQRAAVLNKNVLTQCDTLILLQVNSPQDQDAIEDYIKRNGTKEQHDLLMASLSSLGRGEAWFFSPGWMREFKKIHIRERRTFNSSATPKAGEKVIMPQKLAKVDLEKLGKEISQTVERAKENDPSALKRANAELRQKLAKLEKAVPAPAKMEIKEVPVVTQEQIQTLEREALKLDQACKQLEKTINGFYEGIGRVVRAQAQKSPGARPLPAPLPQVKRNRSQLPLASNGSHGGPTLRLVADPRSSELGKCERVLLSVLAQHPEGCNRKKLILLAGYCWSGSTQNALGKLRTVGAVQGDNSGVMQITEQGQAFGPFEPLPEADQLRSFWLSHSSFGLCGRKLLQAFFDNPEGLTRDQLLELSGYTWSGSTQNALGKLRTAEVITGRNNEVMRLSEELLV